VKVKRDFKWVVPQFISYLHDTLLLQVGKYYVCTYAVVCAAASRGLRVRRLRSVLQTERESRARCANRFAFVNRVVNSVYNWVLIKRAESTWARPDRTKVARRVCPVAVFVRRSQKPGFPRSAFIYLAADRPKSNLLILVIKSKIGSAPALIYANWQLADAQGRTRCPVRK
jgi:hypothetical protein